MVHDVRIDENRDGIEPCRDIAVSTAATIGIVITFVPRRFIGFTFPLATTSWTSATATNRFGLLIVFMIIIKRRDFLFGAIIDDVSIQI